MKEKEFYMTLENCGFTPVKDHLHYPPAGTLYRVPKTFADGYYWIYYQKDLFNIKIHDFCYHKDTVFELQPGQWPQCLNIAYYDSVSGEELNPYRHLMAGCVKTFFGGNNGFKSIFHKGIPLRSIGIEIFPAYYEQHLKKLYPNEYIDPAFAFHSIDQTQDFPEMVTLLKQIYHYRGDGLSAKLFYEAKVAESISLIMDYSQKKQPHKPAVSEQDQMLIANVTNYIQDHFNCELPLEQLAKIACMGTTKLKTTFKAVHSCTITQYIKERRLSHAETLLSTTNLTVEQIALSVGYHNAGRFASLFYQSCGLYPAEYRRLSQNTNAK